MSCLIPRWLFLASMAFNVAAHVYLLDPPSRNMISYEDGQEYCPHCLQANGPGAVKARGHGIWPTKDDPSSHGLCGDPVQNSPEPLRIADMKYMKATSPQRTYVAGSIVEFKVVVSTHHWGHYEFRICDQVLDQNLKSAETGQKCLNTWLLVRAPRSPSCGDNFEGDCQRGNPLHPERWYLPPPGSRAVHTMRFVIPKDLSCERCTLQWYYATGNSCAYDADYFVFDPGFKFWNHYKAGWAKCSNSCCGPQGTGLWGEEFWNCADVAVVSHETPTKSSSTFLRKATTTTAAPTSEPTSEPRPEPEPEPESSSTSSMITRSSTSTWTTSSSNRACDDACQDIKDSKDCRHADTAWNMCTSLDAWWRSQCRSSCAKCQSGMPPCSAPPPGVCDPLCANSHPESACQEAEKTWGMCTSSDSWWKQQCKAFCNSCEGGLPPCSSSTSLRKSTTATAAPTSEPASEPRPEPEPEPESSSTFSIVTRSSTSSAPPTSEPASEPRPEPEPEPESSSTFSIVKRSSTSSAPPPGICDPLCTNNHPESACQEAEKTWSMCTSSDAWWKKQCKAFCNSCEGGLPPCFVADVAMESETTSIQDSVNSKEGSTPSESQFDEEVPNGTG